MRTKIAVSYSWPDRRTAITSSAPTRNKIYDDIRNEKIDENIRVADTRMIHVENGIFVCQVRSLKYVPRLLILLLSKLHFQLLYLGMLNACMIREIRQNLIRHTPKSTQRQEL